MDATESPDLSGLLRAALSHHSAGRRAEAEALCRRVLAAVPNHPGALHVLGLMAQGQGRLGVALKLMRMAASAAPGVADFHNSLGTVLADLGRMEEALAAFGEAVRLWPHYAEAHRNRGVALARAGRLEEAVGPLTEAARLQEGQAGEAAAWEDLAALHHQRLDLPAAVQCRRRVVALRPGDAAARGDLLLTLHYSDDYSPGQLLEEHREWSRRHEKPLAKFAKPHAKDCDPERVLRVGYVSGDFREHPAARFVLPLLQAHDRRRVLVVCYSDVGRQPEPGATGLSAGVTKPGRQTQRFRAAADLWRDCSDWDDEGLARAVREDQIDVLVDLAGHLDSRRLTMFARRPAPLQVGYFGYPATTGTDCVGYRVTDPWLDPPGSEAFCSEELVRLEGGCWCYKPLSEGDESELPEVGPLPALSRGHVTFGAFSRLIKASPQAVRLWAQVLQRVEGSVLAVLAPPGAGGAEAARAALAREGIEPGRLRVLPGGPRRQYLDLYNQVDVALDTFPYNGMTTTCDALWMGVPVVTLVGEAGRPESRTGLALLSAAGLAGLSGRAAETPEQFAGVAVNLATDLPRLAGLRAGLRGRVAASPLGDPCRVARALEAAYRRLWRRWCGGEC